MSTRRGYWWGGVAVGVGLALFADAIGAAGCDGSGGLFGFLGGLFAMGIFGEIVARLRQAGSRGGSVVAQLDATPADGVVEVLAIPGFSGEANGRDPRFRGFTAFDNPPPSGKRGRPGRTTPPLLGRVVFASLFLGRDGKAWAAEEIARSLAALIRAGEWIEREAMRYGAAVNVQVADPYFSAVDPVREREVELAVLPEGEGEGLFDADAEVRLVASASRAAALLGFRDVADLAGQVAARVEADALVWIIQPRSAGRSFVVSEAQTGMRGVSLAICYAREDDFPGPLIGPPYADPATYAHEVLHLFGATDKYGVPLSRFPDGAVSRHEIMRLDLQTLGKLRIDPGTAAEVGWQT